MRKLLPDDKSFLLSIRKQSAKSLIHETDDQFVLSFLQTISRLSNVFNEICYEVLLRKFMATSKL